MEYGSAERNGEKFAAFVSTTSSVKRKRRRAIEAPYTVPLEKLADLREKARKIPRLSIKPLCSGRAI
jgi:hypothetical protein